MIEDNTRNLKLDPDTTFNFGCNKGSGCFTECCGDVIIFLSPYDIVRMKNRLGIPSYEFLEKHTILPIHKEMRFPIRILKMNDDDKKRCPFVTDEGCSIYEARPWPCRMYPVTEEPDPSRAADKVYALIREDRCKGHDSANCEAFTLGQWLDDQSLREYDDINEQFLQVTDNKFFDAGGMLNEQKMHMFHTAAYDIDRFRIFVFETKFLKMYEIDGARLEKMKTDDMELLRFGFDWLRFSLFGEDTIKPSEEAVRDFKQGAAEAEEAKQKAGLPDQRGWHKKE
jgi:Fe-S-cluster containining protein